MNAHCGASMPLPRPARAPVRVRVCTSTPRSLRPVYPYQRVSAVRPAERSDQAAESGCRAGPDGYLAVGGVD
jgi:hypothetical protein